MEALGPQLEVTAPHRVLCLGRSGLLCGAVIKYLSVCLKPST